MHRFEYVLFILIAISAPLLAQDDVATLKNRIAELEAENSELYELVTMLEYSLKVQDGVEDETSIGDGRTAHLVVAPEGWGDCSPEGIMVVCQSCAETVFQAIRPEKGRELTILVIPDAYGPMVLSQRGTNGEYLVLLNSGDRYWAQVAYQFSHELGHILCGDLSLEKPQRWFEESFCESLSLWTLDKMGVSWKTKPPFETWKSYAPRITDFINEVRDRVPDPTSLSDWYRQHRLHLGGEPYDRDKNLALAKYLAKEAHKDPAFFQAFYYLRRNNSTSDDSMEKLLADWMAECPEQLQFAPQAIADTMGLTLQK